MTPAELAALVDGTLAGPHVPDLQLVGVAPLDRAGPDQIAYLEASRPCLEDCGAGALLVGTALPGRACVVVADPKLAFIAVLQHLFPEVHEPGVHPGAHVHPSAQLGEDVSIYPGAWIGPDCVVGKGAVIFPNAVLYPGTVVGPGSRVHAGAVLGADGFSYHPTPSGPVKVPQVGTVAIGAEVEIGANACVDRAFLEATVVGSGAKIDNLVQVAHNVEIGHGSVVAAQAGISGSVSIGDGVLVGGQVGITEHVHVGDGAQIGAKTGVHRDVPAGMKVLGQPAQPLALARRIMATLRHLPEMWHRLRRLEQRVDDLER